MFYSSVLSNMLQPYFSLNADQCFAFYTILHLPSISLSPTFSLIFHSVTSKKKHLYLFRKVTNFSINNGFMCVHVSVCVCFRVQKSRQTPHLDILLQEMTTHAWHKICIMYMVYDVHECFRYLWHGLKRTTSTSTRE